MSFKAWTSPLFTLFVSSKCEIYLSQTPILFLRDTHSRKGRVCPFCVHIHKYIKKKKNELKYPLRYIANLQFS